MKLRSISLQNVRRFTGHVRIDGIGDGLNVLCEPNEHGKSTLFDAVQALFFKPHGSRDRDVLALRPHAGGAPEVAIEVETPAGRFTVSKRWLSRAEASVTQNGRLVAQADLDLKGARAIPEDAVMEVLVARLAALSARSGARPRAARGGRSRR